MEQETEVTKGGSRGNRKVSNITHLSWSIRVGSSLNVSSRAVLSWIFMA